MLFVGQASVPRGAGVNQHNQDGCKKRHTPLPEDCVMGLSTRNPWRLTAALLLFALALAGLSVAPHAVVAQEGQRFTYDHDAKIAQDWMTLLYDRIEFERISAPAASRLYGYAGVTLYEAVLNGMPGNNSFAGQIDHMPDMPLPLFDAPYDWPAVANAALAGVYHSLFDTGSQETHDAIDFLHDKYLIARRAEVGVETANRSVEYGQEIAQAIIDWKATDNYAETRNRTWDMPTDYASFWTPPAKASSRPSLTGVKFAPSAWTGPTSAAFRWTCTTTKTRNRLSTPRRWKSKMSATT